MVQVFDISDKLDISKILPDVLNRLPCWRLKKALAYRFETDRFLCAKSFLMLEEMLRQNCGLDTCPEFSYESNGKPYLKERPDIFFNISHCRKGIACAVSDRPIGVDIEEIQYDGHLAEIILNASELEAVRKSAEPSIEFTTFWTCKESCLKLTGEGIRDDMKNILSDTTGICLKTEINRSAGYVCTVAADSGTKNRADRHFAG